MRRSSRVIAVLATASLATTGLLVAGSSPVAALQVAAVFEFTGGPQGFVVPFGVTTVRVTASGAEGGSSAGQAFTTSGGTINGPSAPGGSGSRSTDVVAVTSGETLEVNVGGRGGDASATATATQLSVFAGEGGFNGGGQGTGSSTTNGIPATAAAAAAAGGGGGASDVRRGGTDLDDRIVVGGGGGGGGAPTMGAEQVGPTGTFSVNPGGVGGNGVNGNDGSGPSPGAGGEAATGVAAGAGGAVGGLAGSADTGGNGGAFGSGNATTSIVGSGGAGGGGFFGGGGGGVTSVAAGINRGGGGGGGTGSSLGDLVVFGSQSGNGLVVITWFVQQPDLQVRTLPNGNFVGDDIYNLDGAGQGVSKLVKPGKSVKFVVRVQNDGAEDDTFRLVANTTQKKFTARYFIDEEDVTQEVAFGVFTGGIADGDFFDVTVKVSASANAKPGQSFQGALSAQSLVDPFKADTVRYVATAK